MQKPAAGRRRWLFPALYAASVIISLLPLYTEKPYAPQDTQDVILSLMSVATAPYAALAIIFHFDTLLIAALIAWKPNNMDRLFAGYIGVNYLLIGAVQGIGTTEKYGFVVHTGLVALCLALAVVWLVTALRSQLEAPKTPHTWKPFLLLPLALLAFWSPLASAPGGVQPNFDPLLLLTAPAYGLTFCLTTPVLLFLLIVFYPQPNLPAYRLTAFNGLLYGLFNLTHWFTPGMLWMGVLHLPLLIISIYALWLPQERRLL